MKKTCNSTYLRHKKVGWNEEILEFGLLQYIYGPADKIPNGVGSLSLQNLDFKAQYRFFCLKSPILPYL